MFSVSNSFLVVAIGEVFVPRFAEMLVDWLRSPATLVELRKSSLFLLVESFPPFASPLVTL